MTKKGLPSVAGPVRAGGGMLLLAGLALAAGLPAAAQVVLDGSLGRAGALPGPHFAVTADLGRQVGANLFHSFSQFGIAQGQSATFSGPSGIANVISRVTGGTASTIDGLVRSTIPDAGFYFFNPAGVAFGPNASIDVGGAFRVSTAHQLRLAGGGRFDAADPAASTLTAAPPEAFGFLGPAGALDVAGTWLAGREGAPFELVGGAVTLRDGAYVTVPAGSLGLASLAGPGEVRFDSRGLQSATGERGAIRIVNSVLSTSGFHGLDSGSVRILGGSVALDFAHVSAFNYSPVDGGGIGVEAAERLDMRASILDTDTLGDGASGGVRITTPVLRLRDVSSILASTYTAASGGPVEIRAGEVEILSGSRIVAESYGRGAGGNISIRADRGVRVLGGGQATGVSTRASDEGAGGSVEIVTPTLEIDGLGEIVASTAGPGRGGSIVIDAGDVSLSGLGTIDLTTWGEGAAGNLDLRASRSLSIRGYEERRASGLFAQSHGDGPGGQLRLASPIIRIEDGGTVSAYTSGGGRGGSVSVEAGELVLRGGGDINVGTYGAGEGGSLAVAAERSIVIEPGSADFESGFLATSDGTGTGGAISIRTPRLVVDGGLISTTAYDAGHGGSATVVAGEIQLLGGGRITANAFGSGAGGNLDVRAEGSLRISGSNEEGNSGLYASSSGRGDGGAIFASAPFVEISGGGTINALANGAGRGGAIEVEAGELVLRGGQMSATTFGSGAAGDVSLRADRITLAESARIWAQTAQYATGAGGSILIDAGELHIEGGSQVTASSFGSGHAGNLVARATREVTMGGDDGQYFSGLWATSARAGDGGSIRVDAPRVLVEDGARVSATVAGEGRGGSITIEAAELEVRGARVTVTTSGSGDAGDLALRADRMAFTQGARIYAQTAEEATGRGGSATIDAGELRVEGGSQVSASSFGAGHAGDLTVRATREIALGGNDGQQYFSGLFAAANRSGAGGTLRLAAPRILVEEGALVSAAALREGRGGSIAIEGGQVELRSGGRVQVSSTGSGAAGDLSVSATDGVIVSGSANLLGSVRTSGFYAETSATGAGGHIQVVAPNVAITDGGLISARSSGTGVAGSIRVAATDSLVVAGGAAIATRTAQSDGGNIAIESRGVVQLSGGSITTSVQGGAGDGGNIAIAKPQHVVLNDAQIQANAYGGDGGNIAIDSAYFIASPRSVVEASSRLGVSGSVTVTAPVVDIGAGLGVLPAGFFDASRLLREACASRAGESENSFVVVGRGSLPESAWGSYASRSGRSASAPCGGMPR